MNLFSKFKRLDVPAVAAPVNTLDTMKTRYAELCAVRDETNAGLAALKSRLNDANAKVAAAQAEASEIAAQIDTIRGGARWIEMKKEIGLLAAALSGKL